MFVAGKATRDKHSSLFRTFDEALDKFDNIGPWCQQYKMFYNIFRYLQWDKEKVCLSMTIF
jgi:hypothetical protein